MPKLTNTVASGHSKVGERGKDDNQCGDDVVETL